MALDLLFYPKSVCILGSSKLREPQSIVSPIVFKSISYNLKAFFKRKSFVLDIEKTKHFKRSDLYVAVLPERMLFEHLQDFDCDMCVIIPGGYQNKEKLSNEMAQKQIRFLGPNSVCGVINTENNLNTTFERGQFPRNGEASFIAQSGGVGAMLFDYSLSSFTGVSKIVWLGNGWDIEFSELLRYFSEDKQTKSIGIYMEGLENGKGFMKTAKKSKKPIVIYKGGSSEGGAKRALSHTASLSGSSQIYSSAFRQSGVIEASSAKELYEVANALSQKKQMKGRRIAIVSNVGGPSILAADYALKSGLELPKLSKNVEGRIRERYPNLSTINPIDLVADADGKRFGFCLKEVLEDDKIDGVLVINMLKSCTLQAGDTNYIADIIKKSKKPIIDCSPTQEDRKKVQKIMENHGIYVFDDLEIGVKALKAVYDYNIYRSRK